MTGQRTNRLIAASPSGAGAPLLVNGEVVPTQIDDYCAWLNGREQRNGRWVVESKANRREVNFIAEIATDNWLREKGLVPQIGRAA